MARRMGLGREGFEAMAEAAKGRLWARGIFLAEAEIEGGVEPIGRWSNARSGAGSARSGAGARPGAADPIPGAAALAEDPGFESVAA